MIVIGDEHPARNEDIVLYRYRFYCPDVYKIVDLDIPADEAGGGSPKSYPSSGR